MTITAILGIDLSGPTNTKDTVAAAFKPVKGGLTCTDIITEGGDGQILSLAEKLNASGTLAVGLDAPLSYNPGGGDRPADRQLRQTLTRVGLKSGTIMPPTMNRMVYLTLRGMALARMLETVCTDVFIAEIHPAGAMALRKAPAADVRNLKSDQEARARLLAWMTAQGLSGIEKKRISATIMWRPVPQPWVSGI
jgi:predicted nuclease with RNAse H fold